MSSDEMRKALEERYFKERVAALICLLVATLVGLAVKIWCAGLSCLRFVK